MGIVPTSVLLASQPAAQRTPETLPRLLDRDRAEPPRRSLVMRDLDQLKATHPGAPPRAMVLERCSRLRPILVCLSMRGNPGRPGKAVASAIPCGPQGWARATAVHEGKRPPRTRPRDRVARQPADGSGLRQPRLDAPFRHGDRHDAKRLRSPEATRRSTPNCWTGSLLTSSRTAGRSSNCTASSCVLMPRIGSRVTLGPSCSRRTPRTASTAGPIADASTSRRPATQSSRPRVRSTPRWEGGAPDRRAAVPPSADDLRLHRSPESRPGLSYIRLRQPRREQSASVHHDGPAAGSLPDEQPVLAGAGPIVSPPCARTGGRHAWSTASSATINGSSPAHPTATNSPSASPLSSVRSKPARPCRRRSGLTATAVSTPPVVSPTSRRSLTGPVRPGRSCGPKLPDPKGSYLHWSVAGGNHTGETPGEGGRAALDCPARRRVRCRGHSRPRGNSRRRRPRSRGLLVKGVLVEALARNAKARWSIVWLRCRAEHGRRHPRFRRRLPRRCGVTTRSPMVAHRPRT